jgi:dTDP-4-dehydrorhamnose 3,5-epimerase
MRFKECPIPDARVIVAEFHEDHRGRFYRAWCSEEFAAEGIDFRPVQANMGLSSRKGTLRGLHYQVAPDEEAKLMRCTRGAIFDVLVDLRPGSPTYTRWFGVELSAGNGTMLFVPKGCAHGYQTLEDDTEIHYMTSTRYTPEAVRGVRFDDEAFGIPWPLPVSRISEQDRGWPPFIKDDAGER